MSRLLFLAFFTCLVSTVHAAESSKCDTKNFLEVSGKAVSTTDSHSFVFAEPALLKLPTSKITTATEWATKSDYIGPELKTILHAAGADGKMSKIRVFAADNYEVNIPVSDLEVYRPILAYEKNGERLQVTTFGPLFLVYPRDQHPELEKILGQAKYVWMVCRIDVE